MLKKMNLPNKLTMLRIALVPVFVIFMVLVEGGFEWAKWVSLVLFIVASLTDFIDGKISRKYNLITNFGKLVDPLADKLLVSTGFIMLTGAGIIPAYITAIVVFRDFIIDTARMFAAKNNVTVAAKLSGKIKTFFTMTGLSLSLIDLCINSKAGFGSFIANAGSMNIVSLFVNVFMTIMLCGAVLTTIWSLIDYVVKSKEFINIEE